MKRWSVNVSDLLPHGPEFRFLDRVTAVNPGVSAEGIYDVRGNEAFLAGHFPGNPIVPGVILIEALAQLSGIAAQSHPEIPPLGGLRLTAVRGAKILDTASPGETLSIRASVDGRMGLLIQASGEIRAGERLLLTAAVTLSGSRGEGPA